MSLVPSNRAYQASSRKQNKEEAYKWKIIKVIPSKEI